MTEEDIKRLRSLLLDLEWSEFHAAQLRSEIRNIIDGKPRPEVLTLRERFETRPEVPR